MRFALLGSHPDGIDMASALVQSGRHQLLAHSDPLPEEWRLRLGSDARKVRDVEEILADPAVEAVIVAGSPTVRPQQLRRALQAERHVLCVHPPDPAPELAYEAALLRDDARVTLMPLLTLGSHPAVKRLREWVDEQTRAGQRLTLLQWTGPAEQALAGEPPRVSIRLWDLLQSLGGEIAEVAGFAEGDTLDLESAALLAGRFSRGGLFQATVLPGAGSTDCRVAVHLTADSAKVEFPQGMDGPAFLCRSSDLELAEESFPAHDPWPRLVEQFEAARAGQAAGLRWQDAVRALELDDAARRAVARRRAELLEYPEASEEVGFKGTMTLVGCGVLLLSLLLLIVGRWVPAVGWLILPLLATFLFLQFLRPLARSSTEKKE